MFCWDWFFRYEAVNQNDLICHLKCGRNGTLDAALAFFGAIVIALDSDAKRPNVEKRIEAQPSPSATIARAPQTITPQVQSDNAPISGVTMANYGRIQTGMTYTQVVQILGKSGTELSSNEIAGYRTVMYQWQGDGIANMNVMFQNGKVIQKAQFGLK